MVPVRAFYTSAYKSKISSFAVFDGRENMYMPGFLLLNARLAYRLTRGPVALTAGLEMFNLLDTEIREHAGLSITNDRDEGAERFDRRFVLFLQGEI